MALIHLSKEGFQQALTSGQLMAVDYWADWCGPCRMLAPAVDKLAEKFEGKALIGKVNIDQEQELAISQGVMSIPTVIFYKDGKELSRQVGLMPGQNPVDALTKVLEDNL